MKKQDRAVAVIISNDKILLMHRLKRGRDYYILPGGSVERGETKKQACIREVFEETGLKVKLKKKLFSLKVNGRTGYYFLIKDFEGQLKLGGPERERHSYDNQYILEWILLNQLYAVDLLPDKAKQKLIKKLK